MIKIDRKTNFIEKANQKYNYYYKYAKFIYVNAKTKGIIICPKHGDFEQTPDKHLNATYPCPDCLAEHRSEVMQNRRNKGDLKNIARPFSYFVKKAERKFGKNKFDYDEESYNGMMEDMKITCKTHGVFTKTPHNFLISSHGCSECASDSRVNLKTKDYEDFIKEAKKVHGDKYNYPIENKEIYENRKSVISIICEKHGEFKKIAQKHLSGQGCFMCNVEKLIDDGILVGGYNEELFKNNEALRNEKGILYYLSINNGECYKIGITKNSGLDRANALKWKSNGDIQDVQVLNEYEDTLENVYNYEQRILKEFADIRTYRHYSTELFKEDIRDKELFKSIFN